MSISDKGEPAMKYDFTSIIDRKGFDAIAKFFEICILILLNEVPFDCLVTVDAVQFISAVLTTFKVCLYQITGIAANYTIMV